MIWLWVIAIAIATIVVGWQVLKLPRNALTALAAALAVGLAGYAWQGDPRKPASPPVTKVMSQDMGEQLVNLRRDVLSEDDWSRNRDAMITADAFARMGRFRGASEAYSAIVRRDPEDAEAWLSLGNALLGHTGGDMTPPALHAFRTAEKLAPNAPGVPFFLGLALIQQGNFEQGRAAWMSALARMGEGSEAHAMQVTRLQKLDELVAQFVPSQSDGETSAVGAQQD